MVSPILLPAAVLVVWSLVMLLWLAATRLPALSKAGVSLGSAVGSRGADLEGVIPDVVNWKSHNYTHLMEQPTIFYAAVFILVLAGADGGINPALAWAYTILRILHSIVQATWNRVAVRFSLFLIASAALFAMTVNAVRATM